MKIFIAVLHSPQVEYKDFPKNNKNEFVSLINCSSQPPLISHGIGKDVESCHDMVSMTSMLDLQDFSFFFFFLLTSVLMILFKESDICM